MAKLHGILAAHRFYPLLASSALAAALLAGRVVLSGNLTLVFLAWNLTLAWVPWVCSTAASAARSRAPILIAGAVWLAFLPNAPYLVTDFLHLRHRAPIPLWYDIALLSSFAWTGCLLAVVSLRAMHVLVARRLGAVAGWAFVAASAGLTGLGIYIGRFLRWNSWDLAVRPAAVIEDLIPRTISLTAHLRLIGVTVTFAAVFLVTYLVFEGGLEGADRAADDTQPGGPSLRGHG
jgi:uncharacterized membrane protein